MSEHRVTVSWKRETPDFAYDTFSRSHGWEFEGGVSVPASSAAGYGGDPDRVDPEQAFVAALSSCHMLTFLALAARKRLVVDRYRDAAVGVMGKKGGGKVADHRVVVGPEGTFFEPPAAQADMPLCPRGARPDVKALPRHRTRTSAY